MRSKSPSIHGPERELSGVQGGRQITSPPLGASLSVPAADLLQDVGSLCERRELYACFG